MDQHMDILLQLAELKKWHENHCGEAEDVSAEDQAKIYKMLGLSPSFINEIEISQSSPAPPTEEVLNNSVSPREVTDYPRTGAHLQPIDHLKINNNLSGTDTEAPNIGPVAKRPFLKRGEGLTNRFKMHPDRYKLQNLPKYKFMGGTTAKLSKRKSAEKQPPGIVEKDPPPQPAAETPFKYNIERTRKSCLKTDSVVDLDELRTKMTALCTNAFKDDSGEGEDTTSASMEEEEEAKKNDDNAKRMLDFSRKSPRVTFHSEVTKIPFEHYFNPPNGHFQDQEDEGEEEEEEDEEESCTVTESLACDFNVDAAFQKHAVISTPVEVFKEKQQQHLHVENSPRTALAAKGSQLLEKIKELEEEAQNFREQNRQVQKLKQSLELEKVQLMKARAEQERSFKEQQLKLELNYEKLKESLDEERVKVEQRSLVPSKKLKEETKSLKDKIDQLEKEIKNREVKHGASQTRLRCHIRTLEKENREQTATVDTLRKENKRLEAENSRLLRQKNNKMLTEINKNIAKLASPSEGKADDVPKVAPVTKPVRKMGTVPVPKLPPQKAIVSSLNHRKEPESVDNSLSDSSIEEDSEEAPTTGQSHYFPSTVAYNKRRGASAGHSTVDAEKENKQATQTAPSALNDTTPGPKKEIVNEDGSKDVYYPNGNLKKISADAMVVKVLYFNKDIKETNINEGTVKYYYAETKTWHTSYLDGLEILEFPSGQKEHRFKNGKIEIYFPNGLLRITNPRDNEVLEEWRYPDGTVVLETKAKEKIIKLPNGQKEIHTEGHKRREYPDGTVKLVYSEDGRTETRYSNGRIRIKDKDGRLISDSQNAT